MERTSGTSQSAEPKVGTILRFHGKCFRLLHNLEVTFDDYLRVSGNGPFIVSTLPDAYAIVRSRFPEAFWKRWDDQTYDFNTNGGYDFYPVWKYPGDGKHDEKAHINLACYAKQADLVHEEMYEAKVGVTCPRFHCAQIAWRMEQQD